MDVKDIRYTKLSDGDLPTLYKHYFRRHNLSCESVPVDSYMWRDVCDIYWTVIDDECMLMVEDIGDGYYAGCLPICAEDKLTYYFKIQEEYFNKVLHIPLEVLYADEAGLELLKAAGLMEDYEITENEELRDFLYDGETMRSLKGRKLSKKRNHIHRFETLYDGKWEYRSLKAEDREQVCELFEAWKREKDIALSGNEEIDIEDADLEIELEYKFIKELFDHADFFDLLKVGGIFIEGKLKAFAIGSYNGFDKMAVINIEKADASVEGLYQVINQQFLIHEFPDAELVNREDAAGDEGLYKSKMSYFPIGFGKKYRVCQKP